MLISSFQLLVYLFSLKVIKRNQLIEPILHRVNIEHWTLFFQRRFSLTHRVNLIKQPLFILLMLNVKKCYNIKTLYVFTFYINK